MAAAFEVFAGETADRRHRAGLARAARRLPRRHAGARAARARAARGARRGAGARGASPRCIAPASGCGRSTRRCRRRSAASGSRTPRRWRRGRGGCVDAGDIAMVKGSLGSRVGQVVEAIKTMGEARPAEAPRREHAEDSRHALLPGRMVAEPERAQRLPLHHLPRGRRLLHRARLRLPVRAAADRDAAGPPGPRPADPERRAGEPPRHQAGHADHGRAADPFGDPGLDAALGALVERLRLDGDVRDARASG